MQIWTRAGKYKLGAKAVKYKLGTRTGKYKLGARTAKYKLGARAGKYKIGARARGEGRGPGNTKTHFLTIISDLYFSLCKDH